jgi:hypothetical protein
LLLLHVGRCFAVVVVVVALFECCLCLFTRHCTLVRLVATRTTLAPWIKVKISKSIIIRRNAATSAAIHKPG